MTQEQKNERISLGGDINYLKFLVSTYGGEAKIGTVALAERTRLVGGLMEDIDRTFMELDETMLKSQEVEDTQE